MAQKTLVIYPSSDVSLGHSCSTGSSGYPLINEETADDDTTYIYQSLSTSSSSKTSTFKCTNSEVTRKIYLRAISSFFRAKYTTSGSASVSTSDLKMVASVSINNGTSSNSPSLTPNSNYGNFNTDYTESTVGLNTKYDSISDANIVIGLQTTGKYSSNKSASATIRITQANVTITYSDIWNCLAYSVAGSGIKTVTVADSEVIDEESTTFTATLEDNYIFDGWYSDAECTNKVSSDLSYTTAITDDTTLYAKGTLEYTVTVYGDDHSTATASASKAPGGTSITVTATITSDNYRFKGWYSNYERTTLVSTDNPYIFTLNEDTVLYVSTDLNEVIYVKVDGVWKACSKAYKKIDGIWVEQTTLSGLFDTEKKYKIINV